VKSATKDKEYTSPVPKLARFFEKSRDQWKAKCREAKRMLKCLKSRNRFLQKSRDQWRQKAKRLAQELAEAQATERELREEADVVHRPPLDSAAGLLQVDAAQRPGGRLGLDCRSHPAGWRREVPGDLGGPSQRPAGRGTLPPSPGCGADCLDPCRKVQRGGGLPTTRSSSQEDKGTARNRQ
jgi:hypothetical protein